MIKNVTEFLRNSVENYPDKTMLVEYNGRSITYREFDELSNRLASHIVAFGVLNQLVLIVLPKGIDALIAYFGIIKSGNYYSIIDHQTPVERLNKMLGTIRPQLVITQKNCPYQFEVKTLTPDDFCTADINTLALEQIERNQIDTDLLYVLLTSGSTGIPKGVSITHRGVIDYTSWVCETFSFDENSVLANQAPFYFDNSILDIYSTIKAGGTLHIIPNNLYAFPKKIMEYIAQHQVNTIFWVPSVLIYFANTNACDHPGADCLKKILFCGEIMPNKQLNIWRRRLPGTLFANLYGPTEITDVCCYHIVEREFRDDELLPIGKACRNTGLIVFDENLKLITPKDPGVKGELYVRGTCLSSGYYNDKEKTDKVFVQNPQHSSYHDLLYKTGDVVAYNEYGELLCYGRIDNQIKYMGHRIELGEIESVIGSHQDIRNCACIFKDEIICFYESDTEPDLNQYLQDRLPGYMIPKKFVKVQKFALNQNGKIDRKVLKEL